MTCFARRHARTIRSLAHFAADENGATSIEYTIIASMISVAIVGAVTAVDDAIKQAFYDKIVNALTGM